VRAVLAFFQKRAVEAARVVATNVAVIRLGGENRVNKRDMNYRGTLNTQVMKKNMGLITCTCRSRK
jgi:hypothetical protein